MDDRANVLPEPPEGSSIPSLPFFVRLVGRAVLVVGAGPVATRKIRALVASGAKVVVVAPEATDEVRSWAESGAIQWLARAFQSDDVQRHRPILVLAATGSATVDDEVAARAEAEGRLVTHASDGPRSSALFAPTVRRGPFTVAVSSEGELPALTRLVCQVIEAVLPAERWVQRARSLRQAWKLRKTPTADRFAELVQEIAEHRRQPRAPSDDGG